MELHKVIKFWARKPTNLIVKELPRRANVIADPFCGSGTTGFSGLLKEIDQIFLSDINPVSIFVSSTLLSRVAVSEEVLNDLRKLCEEIENEVYTIGDYKVSYAVWATIFVCPRCGGKFRVKRISGRVKCRSCGVSLPPRFFTLDEELLHVFVENGNRLTKISDGKTLREYLVAQEELELKQWYPQGTFEYPDSKMEFRDGPHRHMEIKDLFTKRNLYAVSKIYNEIEKLWKNCPEQGDVLKLAFIASLANATKMIPHAQSSGPSWKVPRYWIPNIREERNFCKAFTRRLKIVKDFKERLLATAIHNYSVNTFYGARFISRESSSCKNITIFRSDARDAHTYLPECDFIVLDPPHYDQIDYYELYYLWQKWLEGGMCDERFRDYSFWKNELSINNRVGHDLDYYNKSITEIISSYADILKKNGKLILILHSRDLTILKNTIENVKKKLDGFYLRSRIEWPSIPSSSQGIHGRKKFLYILQVYKKS